MCSVRILAKGNVQAHENLICMQWAKYYCDTTIEEKQPYRVFIVSVLVSFSSVVVGQNASQCVAGYFTCLTRIRLSCALQPVDLCITTCRLEIQIYWSKFSSPQKLDRVLDTHTNLLLNALLHTWSLSANYSCDTFWYVCLDFHPFNSLSSLTQSLSKCGQVHYSTGPTYRETMGNYGSNESLSMECFNREKHFTSATFRK